MDLIDKVTDMQAHIFSLRLANQRAKAQQRELTPKSKCFNCDEQFEANDLRLFCDVDCRDDFEKYGSFNG